MCNGVITLLKRACAKRSCRLPLPTLGECRPVSLAPSLAVDCFQQQLHLQVRRYNLVVALSLSERTSRPLSYARVPRVLVSAEAGGIRNTGPPMKEMIMGGCAKGNAKVVIAALWRDPNNDSSAPADQCLSRGPPRYSAALAKSLCICATHMHARAFACVRACVRACVWVCVCVFFLGGGGGGGGHRWLGNTLSGTPYIYSEDPARNQLSLLLRAGPTSLLFIFFLHPILLGLL